MDSTKLEKQMFLLFSHTLSQSQISEATNSLNIKKIVPLSPELQSLWSSVPSDLEGICNYLEPIKKFLQDNSQQEDLVLIQGDFGATYIMVNYAKEIGLTSVYATSERMVKESIEDGKIVKKSIFEHRRFREYGV